MCVRERVGEKRSVRVCMREREKEREQSIENKVEKKNLTSKKLI